MIELGVVPLLLGFVIFVHFHHAGLRASFHDPEYGDDQNAHSLLLLRVKGLVQGLPSIDKFFKLSSSLIQIICPLTQEV